jgi:hypothetical protein
MKFTKHNVFGGLFAFLVGALQIYFWTGFLAKDSNAVKTDGFLILLDVGMVIMLTLLCIDGICMVFGKTIFKPETPEKQ